MKPKKIEKEAVKFYIEIPDMEFNATQSGEQKAAKCSSRFLDI
jgi:hypothetical protein